MQRLKRHLLPLMALSLLSATCLSGDWPCWRGPQRNGVSSDTVAPLHWTPESGIRWKAEIAGAGYCSPIVVRDQVILTASSGFHDEQLHVLSFRLSDGKPAWHTRLLGVRTKRSYSRPPRRGQAAPSIAAGSDRVVAVFGTGEMACVDLEGRPLWFRSLSEDYGPMTNEYGFASTPVLDDQHGYLQVDQDGNSYLLSFDLQTGRTHWCTPRTDTGDNWSTPALCEIAGQRLLICSGTEHIRAYDAATGKPRGRVDGIAKLCCPTPVMIDDRVVVTSGPGGNATAVSVAAMANDDSDEVILWRNVRGGGFIPSPIVVNDLYFHANYTGIVTCLSAETGELVTQKRIGGRFYASPITAQNRIYFTDLTGKTTVVKADETLKTLAENELGEAVAASAAISNGLIFLRGDRHLYCIEGTENKHD